MPNHWQTISPQIAFSFRVYRGSCGIRCGAGDGAINEKAIINGNQTAALFIYSSQTFPRRSIRLRRLMTAQASRSSKVIWVPTGTRDCRLRGGRQTIEERFDQVSGTLLRKFSPEELLRDGESMT
jgi:hypothetical protein